MIDGRVGNSSETLIQGKGLILVVDDEPIMRKIAVNVLQLSGYDVISACDGIEAVEIYKKQHQQIRLVLLDLLMPNKAGKETFMEMAAIDPTVRVLLVTGAKRDHRVEELLHMGVKGYIEKPYKFLRLSEAVFDAIYN